MAGTSAASPRTQTLTVALDLPSAQVLADQIATIQDLQFVMECCKRLLTELVTPEDERDPVVPQALWSAALTAYGRCFSKGTKFGLAADDVRSLPLEGQVLKFHTWIVDERNKLARHAADPFELAKVGTVLSAPGLSAPGLSGGQPDGGEAPGRQLEGITVLSASHILVDGAGAAAGRPGVRAGQADRRQGPGAGTRRPGRRAPARPGHAVHAAAAAAPPARRRRPRRRRWALTPLPVYGQTFWGTWQRLFLSWRSRACRGSSRAWLKCAGMVCRFSGQHRHQRIISTHSAILPPKIAQCQIKNRRCPYDPKLCP